MKYLGRLNGLWGRYFMLSLVVLLPLLKLGYVSSVDMVWGPRIPLPATSDNSYLFVGLLHVLSLVVGAMLVQKVLLLAMCTLMGVGAHKLARLGGSIKEVPNVAYVAGVLYVFNPFVYTRLMQGQWLVLCGYALLPWAIKSFWVLMLFPGWRQAVRASAWTIAVGLVSIHAVGFVLLAHAVLFVVRGRAELKKRLVYVAGATVAWLVVNSLWLVPILDGHSHTSSAISSFGASQLQAFKTMGTVHGSVPLSSLLLEGFWADAQRRYVLPSHLFFWWPMVGLLAALVVLGSYVVLWRRDRLGLVLFGLGVVAWWLGMGVGWHVSASTTNWLVAHVPFYRGYREPQKWLMLLALLYSYLAAVGAGRLLELVRNKDLRQPALAGLMILPVLWTPTLVWGAGGQLVAAEYPADWAVAERTLDADTSNYQVLVLPWHEYLPVSFTGRVIGNPASHYFKQRVIVSDNPEIAGVPPAEATHIYRLIDNQLLPQRNFRTDAAAELAAYNVKYLLLFKEADWQRYSWLNKQTGLTRVQNSGDIALYKTDSLGLEAGK